MKYGLLSAVFVILMSNVITAQECSIVDQHMAKVDPRIHCKNTGEPLADLSENEVIKIFDRLIRNKGNRHKSAIMNASLSPLNSQRFETPSIEVASLYYISYIFLGNSDFASAIALQHGDDTVNSKRAVSLAYKRYKNWLNKVKKIGVAQSRRQKLDPLANSGVTWY